MTKSDLIRQLAEANPHLYQRDIERIVSTVFEEVTEALVRGDRVELRGFGAFSVRHRSSRVGRNPRTGEEVRVPDKAVPYFKTGKELRERLNGDAEASPTPDRRRRLAMIKLLRLMIGIVALVVIIAFAIANRAPVEVGFAPFPTTIELPVYGVFLLGLVVGVLVGGIGVWLGGHARRREARKARNRAWALENQLNVLKREADREQAKRYAAGRGACPPPAATRPSQARLGELDRAPTRDRPGLKIIIIGGGIMGLCSAWALRRAGHQVALYEQGPIPNPLGSSFDQHRLIRYTYGAMTGYARMVARGLCRLAAAVGRSRPQPLSRDRHAGDRARARRLGAAVAASAWRTWRCRSRAGSRPSSPRACRSSIWARRATRSTRRSGGVLFAERILARPRRPPARRRALPLHTATPVREPRPGPRRGPPRGWPAGFGRPR